MATAVLGIEAGFETDRVAIVGEQDILGDRLVRRGRRKKRGADFISEVTGLDEGDIVVHVDHASPASSVLRKIEAAGAPHGLPGAALRQRGPVVPAVENIELLSRYGGEGSEAILDKLGGGAGRRARPS